MIYTLVDMFEAKKQNMKPRHGSLGQQAFSNDEIDQPLLWHSKK